MITKEQIELINRIIDKYNALTIKQRKSLNEANTTNVFIRPLFEALGWDFSNIDEIVAEQLIIKGRADFVFKINNLTRFCIEVKAIHHELTDQDRKQAISYAYNKGVTWAILTNFEKLELFNAEVKANDFTSVRFISFYNTNYLQNLEDLNLLTKESVIKNELDSKAIHYGKLARRIPVEQRLYQELIKWREILFNEIYAFNKENGITFSQTDILVQKLFSRLIFIRTAEDRGLAGNHPLRAALHQWQTNKISLLDSIRQIFQDFAVTFDSSVFPVDDPWQKIWVNDDNLKMIINGLYAVPNDYAEYYFDVIEPDVLGQVYEQYLGYVAQAAKPKQMLQPSLFPESSTEIELSKKKEKRKKGGIYYTPKWVTDYIVKEVFSRFKDSHQFNEILNIKILDPACGSGSFLIRAYDELLSYHSSIEKIPVSALSWFERIKLLTKNIFGVDLDPQAVEIARLNLLIRALAKRDLLPPLEANIQCGNSLIFGNSSDLSTLLGEDYKQYNPLNWEDRFTDIIKSGGFDIVIGNPPYVMELRENKSIFQILRNTPLGTKYYEPKMDLFYFFIELGLDLLKPNGYLGFIVQQYWVSRTHASRLREKIFNETHPLILIDFNEFQVFKDAPGQHNMIIILQKGKNTNDSTLLMNLKKTDVTDRDIISALSTTPENQDLFEFRTVESSALFNSKTDKVYLISGDNSSIKDKIEKESWNLDESEIQVGIDVHHPFLRQESVEKLSNPSIHKTGEGIFVLSDLEVQKLNLNNIEKTILRPFHYAEELDSFYYDNNISYHLLYTPRELSKDIEKNPDKYPSVVRHLNQYQPIITSDQKPYGLHRARQPEWFDDIRKIVGVRKTKYPKFSVIQEQWYGDQAILIIRLIKHSKISPHFIAAILNSKISHFWFLQQKHQGNQLQIDKEVLLHFPFPDINSLDANMKIIYRDLIKLSIEISKIKKERIYLKISGEDIFGEKQKQVLNIENDLEKQINNLVFNLYRLSSSETEHIVNITLMK